MSEPLVSVVILNYNGLKDLKACYESLHSLNYKNIELIFVDNNSQDGNVEFIRENFNKVKIIRLTKNYGFAKGNNIGVTKSKCKYILLLNNDTVVDRNWVSELVKVAEQSDRIGIIGRKNSFITIKMRNSLLLEHVINLEIHITLGVLKEIIPFLTLK